MEDAGAAEVQRASMLLDVGRTNEAIVALSGVLATDPGHVHALCLMSLAHFRERRFPHALWAAQSAIGADPHNEWAYRLASLSHRGLNDDVNSIAAARAAVQLAPNTAATHMALAGALARTKRHIEEASDAAARAINLAPHDPESYIVAAQVCHAWGDDTRARAFLEQALALDPESTSARNELARLHLNRMSPSGLAEAADGFGGTLSVDPRFTLGRRNLEIVLSIFLRRTAYFVFLIALAAYLGSQHDTTAAVRYLPAIGLILPLAYAARFITRLTQPLRRALRDVLRDTRVAPAAGCMTAACASLVAGTATARITHVCFAVAALLAGAARLILFIDALQRQND